MIKSMMVILACVNSFAAVSQYSDITQPGAVDQLYRNKRNEKAALEALSTRECYITFPDTVAIKQYRSREFKDRVRTYIKVNLIDKPQRVPCRRIIVYFNIINEKKQKIRYYDPEECL